MKFIICILHPIFLSSYLHDMATFLLPSDKIKYSGLRTQDSGVVNISISRKFYSFMQMILPCLYSSTYCKYLK